MRALNLIVVGVGGQGVVLASDVIAETALASGYDVKKTDTLGMAQRGGSVVSHVRIGPKVWSPLIKEGDVDIILGFEKLEAVRWRHYLRRAATAIISSQGAPPLSVSLGRERYPSDEEIRRAFREVTGKACLIDAEKHARALGNVKTVNVLMLGCVSVFMPLEEAAWKDCLRRTLPARVCDLNLAAFDLGRKEMSSVDF